MHDKPRHEQQNSDFLPWTLAAMAVFIMAVAVRINADAPPAPPQPQQPDHSPANPPAHV